MGVEQVWPGTVRATGHLEAQMIRRALIAASALVLLGGGLAACGESNGTVGQAPTSPTAAASGSATQAPGSNGGAGQTQSGTVTVPAYYLAEVVIGGENQQIREFRLFREFHKVATRQGGAAVAALYELFGDQADDSDYSSVWPAATSVLSYSRSGDLATVNLSREAGAANAGAEVTERSLQQLVYTVTAADQKVRRVQLLIDGKKESSLWGHVDASAPQSRRPEIDVLAHIWLVSPTEGQTVGRTFTIKGVGTAFEGTVSWDVLQGGTTVKSGFAQAGSGPEREPWQASVTLQPGTYLLRAFEHSAADGSVTNLDTKRITVR